MGKLLLTIKVGALSGFLMWNSSCADSSVFEQEMSQVIDQSHSALVDGKVNLDIETLVSNSPMFAQLNSTVSSLRNKDPKLIKGVIQFPANSKFVAIYDERCRLAEEGIEFQQSNKSSQVAENYILDQTSTFDELVSAADADPCLLQIGNDIHFEVGQSRQDPLARQQLHLSAIGHESVMPYFYGSSGIRTSITVAVLDTGVDYSHPDLKRQMWKNSRGDVGYDFVHSDRDPMDDHSHGTHVAGLIGAEMGNGIGVRGIMGRNVKIMAIKVLPRSGGGDLAPIANGIRWAADQGAHIINMSLAGRGRSSVLESAIQYAVSRGAFVVAAAGNEGLRMSSTRFVSPASYASRISGMIAVGSILSTMDRRSSFSNYSTSEVDIGAPGEGSIMSTMPFGRYEAMSGTSMAAPIVAGAVGLALGITKTRGFNLSPGQIEDLIKRGSPLSSSLRNDFQSGRKLDLRTLEALMKKEYK